MSDFGAKISKEGKATSSTDMRDFILHSGQHARVLRLQDQGSGTIAFTAPAMQTHAMATINHNLGYVPFYQVFGEWYYSGPGGGTVGHDNITHPASDPWGLMFSSTAISTTQLLIDVWCSGGIAPDNAELRYIYYIGRDPI